MFFSETGEIHLEDYFCQASCWSKISIYPKAFIFSHFLLKLLKYIDRRINHTFQCRGPKRLNIKIANSLLLNRVTIILL